MFKRNYSKPKIKSEVNVEKFLDVNRSQDVLQPLKDKKDLKKIAAPFLKNKKKLINQSIEVIRNASLD